MQVLLTGLDTLIQIAEAGGAGSREPDAQGRPPTNAGPRQSSAPEDQDGQRYGSTNASLAADLLQMVGPFNYIQCANPECAHRNEGGTTCELCGHPISFDVT